MSKENHITPAEVNRRRLSRRECLHDAAVVVGGTLIVGGFDVVVYATLSNAAKARELLEKTRQVDMKPNRETQHALEEINNKVIKETLIGAGAMVGGLFIWIKEAITD